MQNKSSVRFFWAGIMDGWVELCLMDQFTLSTQITGASHHQSGERRCNDGELQVLSDTQQKEASLPHLWRPLFNLTPKITHTKDTKSHIHVRTKIKRHVDILTQKHTHTHLHRLPPPVTSAVPQWSFPSPLTTQKQYTHKHTYTKTRKYTPTQQRQAFPTCDIHCSPKLPPLP